MLRMKGGSRFHGFLEKHFHTAYIQPTARFKDKIYHWFDCDSLNMKGIQHGLHESI